MMTSPTFLLLATLLLYLPSVSVANYCSGGGTVNSLAPGQKQQFTCSGTCYACLVSYTVSINPSATHTYYMNFLDNGGNYILDATSTTQGATSGGPSLFGDGDGKSDLQLEIECANSAGNCDGMSVSFGFVNCACAPDLYLHSSCSGTRDADCRTEPKTPSSICFSGDTTVHVQKEKDSVVVPVPMKDLQVGDRVLTNSNEKDPYMPIYMFAHIDKTVPTEYLQIYTTASITTAMPNTNFSMSAPLEISEDHMVYVVAKNGKTTGPVPAVSLKVGDLLLQKASQGEEEKQAAMVTMIRHVTRQGLYAPLTPDGTIVVTDEKLVASTYVTVVQTPPMPLLLHQADMVHVWLSPLRVACLLGGEWLTGTLCENNHNEQGMQYLVALGLDFAKFMDSRGQATRLLLVLLSVIVTGPFRILELALGPSYWNYSSSGGLPLLFLIVAVSCVMFRRTTGGRHGTQKRRGEE
ncbi:Hint module [Seminavis robusta]|uniref:Hint module n=1 Tax=Seminavis robusta TaxID=568900 RepID=A0A9N8E3I7_9STRA|nr:Hint module [Seminavis robusta]|eukprot:Sro622_g177010.1 Hint module (465) ;mRNA; f:39868-41262